MSRRRAVRHGADVTTRCEQDPALADLARELADAVRDLDAELAEQQPALDAALAEIDRDLEAARAEMDRWERDELPGVLARLDAACRQRARRRRAMGRQP